MKRWEYKSERKVFPSVGGGEERWLVWINSEGMEGWELVDISFNNNRDYTESHVWGIFKRDQDR